MTSADALEALHRSTGLPIVADSYTRLYRPEAVSMHGLRLFDTLNQLGDTMRLRWKWEDRWLQFRSTSYYDDRLKEVPNRLLTRWAAARRQRGVLSQDELLEIAQLSDAQLDADDMAEGAMDCFALREWNLARGSFQRPHLRFVAQLSPAQRQESMGATGLPFRRMSLAQQQQFISLVTHMRNRPPQSLEELSRATLRVAFMEPGRFQWLVPAQPGGRGREPIALAFVQERTPEAALQAARRLNPEVEASEIVATETAVTIIYTLGSDDRATSSVAVRATPGSSMGW